jgi:hypothetical protein
MIVGKFSRKSKGNIGEGKGQKKVAIVLAYLLQSRDNFLSNE